MNEGNIYTTINGNKYFSGASIVLNDNEFLLLYDIKNDNPSIAIEKDGKIKFIKDDFAGYYDILGLLTDKVNNSF